jgi:hypothetical protein
MRTKSPMRFLWLFWLPILMAILYGMMARGAMVNYDIATAVIGPDGSLISTATTQFSVDNGPKPAPINPATALARGATQPSPVQKLMSYEESLNWTPPTVRTIWINPAYGVDTDPGPTTRPVVDYKYAESLAPNPNNWTFAFADGQHHILTDSLHKSGISATQPTVLTSYYDPNTPATTRPTLTSNPANPGNVLAIGAVSNFVIEKLDFGPPVYATNSLINWNAPGSFGVFYRDALHGLGGTMAEGVIIQTNAAGPISQVIIEDCIIDNCANGATGVNKVSGVYINGPSDFIVDSNRFDHNGFTPGGIQNPQNHDLYINYGCPGPYWVTNNLFADASSVGGQERSANGNQIVDGNSAYHNPNGITSGAAAYVAGNNQDVSNNIIEGGSSGNGVSGAGGICIVGCDSSVEGNYFNNCTTGIAAISLQGLTIETNLPALSMAVALKNNQIRRDWTGQATVRTPGLTSVEDYGNDWTGSGSYQNPQASLDSYAISVGFASAEVWIQAGVQDQWGADFSEQAAWTYVMTGRQAK